MPRKIAKTDLNARTVDIINVIRQNASYNYQNSVPVINKSTDIPSVGQIICGTPAIANEFLNALVNRIALVMVKASNFYNTFKDLKKGEISMGETVEEVFVEIAKATEFNVEKANEREFKRTIPDVRSAFHVMNYRAQYPITVQFKDLERAFLSEDGVKDLVEKIINSCYMGNEYDEFLLFKYLLIKSISRGVMTPISVTDDMNDIAVKFRGASNELTFLSTKYNASNVHVATPRENQYIFMDAKFNAKYDVEVLANAFNMDKADFIGHLKLIDNWDTFDNERFSNLIDNTTQIEKVTDAELEVMKKVRAVLVDEEFFQIYDNLTNFTETNVASGLYSNYFLNVWKTVSFSPFSNAIVFVEDTVTYGDTLTAEVMSKSVSSAGTLFEISTKVDGTSYYDGRIKYVQTDDAVKNAVAVAPYGSYIFSPNSADVDIVVTVDGITYKSATKLGTTASVGDTITLNKVVA